MSYTIYQDLDGCLSNFEKGYLTLTGQDIRGQFISTPEFWKPISDAKEQFWAELELIEDALELWNYIEQYEPIILSAPSQDISSQIGKDMWLAKHLPSVTSSRRIYCPRWEKMKYANSNSILIDDMEKTIIEWRQSGGIGIVHTSAENTIKQLKELGL